MATQGERIHDLEVEQRSVKDAVKVLNEKTKSNLEYNKKLSERMGKLENQISSWGGGLAFFTKFVVLFASLTAIASGLFKYASG